MKFTSNSRNFSEYVNDICSILPRTSTKPVLQNILVEADEKTVTLSGTDQEIEISVTVRDKLDISETGKVLIQGQQFARIIKEAGDVDIDFEQDGESLNISTLHSHFNLKGVNPEEYTGLGTEKPQIEYKVSGPPLAEIIRKSSFAANREIKQIPTDGTLMEFTENCVTVVSTDGKRLARGEWSVREITEDYSIILPQKTAAAVVRTLGDSEEVWMRISDNAAVFENSQIRVSSRLVSGKFPDYRRVIPNEEGTKVKVDREAFIHALRQVMTVMEADYMGVYIEVGTEKIKLYSDEAQTGSGESEVPAEISGEGVKKKVNSSYLMDVLKGMEEEKIKFDIYSENTPLRFQERKKYLYLLMPLMDNG